MTLWKKKAPEPLLEDHMGDPFLLSNDSEKGSLRLEVRKDDLHISYTIADRELSLGDSGFTISLWAKIRDGYPAKVLTDCSCNIELSGFDADESKSPRGHLHFAEGAGHVDVWLTCSQQALRDLAYLLHLWQREDQKVIYLYLELVRERRRFEPAHQNKARAIYFDISRAYFALVDAGDAFGD